LEIDILEKTPLTLKLYVKDIPLQILNAIRRVMISEVPTMAVDTVVFTLNTSVFYDEIIAHRLGLIPLTSEYALNKYKSPEECRGGEETIFSEECFVKLDLEAENKSNTPLTIYSRDLLSSDPDVKPVYESIPILVLGPGQKIRLEAYARLGRGKEHAKWSPVSVAAHKYVPDIKIDYGKCEKGCEVCIDICPKGIFKLSHGKPVVDKDKIIECTFCRLCESQCPKGAVTVSFREDEYVLSIESTGSLPPKKILLEAIRVLDSKLDDFLEQLRREGVIQ